MDLRVQGRYVDDGLEGSPLLAAKHAKSLSLNHRDYDLRCINVEVDPHVFEDLQYATKPFADNVNNFHGSFSDFVPAILQSIGDQPALFFLDPIGIADLSWKTLEPVFQRSAKTEILVRFDAQTALRLHRRGQESSQDVQLCLGRSKLRILAELFGGLRRNEPSKTGVPNQSLRRQAQ